MTHLHKPTLEVIFSNMTPTTLAAMISDMDEAADMPENDELQVMQFAIDTLFANVGAQEAIELLATFEVDASNPLVADAVEEWTQDKETTHV